MKRAGRTALNQQAYLPSLAYSNRFHAPPPSANCMMDGFAREHAMSSGFETQPYSSDEIETLVEQFRAALRAGQQPDRQAILAAHPHLGERLELRLAMVEMVHRLGLESEPGAPLPDAMTVVTAAVPGTGRPSSWPPDLPDYHIVSELGKGGMGVVYKAVHLRLNRTVALKMIRAGTNAPPEMLARFHVEAEALASLQHPNIVQVYEVGQHLGCPFMSMEFVDGGGLDHLLARRPQPPQTAAALVETLARAMHCAHQRGIVHRDLKPANVLIAVGSGQWAVGSKEGSGSLPTAHCPLPTVLKITDFGLAKRLQASEGQTATGVIMGTPSYMAPEQAQGKTRQIGPPADI